MNLIEQLEAMETRDFSDVMVSGEWIHVEDLRAIIEEHKREAAEPLDYVHNMPGCPGFTVCVFKADRVPCGTSIYLSQPDHTKLIGELVEALDNHREYICDVVGVARNIVIAEGNPEEFEYDHIGYINRLDALLTKAREAIK